VRNWYPLSLSLYDFINQIKPHNLQVHLHVGVISNWFSLSVAFTLSFFGKQTKKAHTNVEEIELGK
jgi:hypothetical protein